MVNANKPKSRASAFIGSRLKQLTSREEARFCLQLTLYEQPNRPFTRAHGLFVSPDHAAPKGVKYNFRETVTPSTARGDDGHMVQRWRFARQHVRDVARDDEGCLVRVTIGTVAASDLPEVDRVLCGTKFNRDWGSPACPAGMFDSSTGVERVVDELRRSSLAEDVRDWEEIESAALAFERRVSAAGSISSVSSSSSSDSSGSSSRAARVPALDFREGQVYREIVQ